MVWRASRGGFTRQAVNVACLEALTKVLPVRLPVRRRQASRQEAKLCARWTSVDPPNTTHFEIVTFFHFFETIGVRAG